MGLACLVSIPAIFMAREFATDGMTVGAFEENRIISARLYPVRRESETSAVSRKSRSNRDR